MNAVDLLGAVPALPEQHDGAEGRPQRYEVEQHRLERQ